MRGTLMTAVGLRLMNVEDAHEGLAGVRVEADLVVEPVAVRAGERDARPQRSSSSTRTSVGRCASPPRRSPATSTLLTAPFNARFSPAGCSVE
jgi:hypothetical protein